jgi:hypothetical protein
LLCVAGFFSGFQQNPVENTQSTGLLQLSVKRGRGPSGGHRIPLAVWYSAVAATISQCRPVPMSWLLPPRTKMLTRRDANHTGNQGATGDQGMAFLDHHFLLCLTHTRPEDLIVSDP